MGVELVPFCGTRRTNGARCEKRIATKRLTGDAAVNEKGEGDNGDSDSTLVPTGDLGVGGVE